METGIFGGSFNPIHIGHAILANMLSQGHGLDSVWLMPSRMNPLKQNGYCQAPDADRLEMCRIVASKCPAVEVCDIEMHLPVPSYTYTTLCALREKYPERRFRLIIGSDNWEIFNQWRDTDRIINEFGVIIYERPGYPVKGDLPENVRIVDNLPQTLISSTIIRERVKKGENINFLVPEGVVNYIAGKGLYDGYE